MLRPPPPKTTSRHLARSVPGARQRRPAARAALVVLSAALTLLTTAPARAQKVDHGPWDAILARYVKDGRVDYAGIKADATGELDRYLSALANTRLHGVSKKERLATYLNAYNALVVRAVVKHYPIASVKQVKGFFDGTRYPVAGRKVTLNQLENAVIRRWFNEPRIHFALVCAAISCPPLPSAAYSSATLDRTLERLTVQFINSPHGVQVAGDGVEVSKLFDWYAADFKDASGSVADYIARYHRRHASALKAVEELGYLRYDWSLNARD